VRLRNDHGEIDVRLAFDDGLLRGVVALTHGWGHAGAPAMRTAARSPAPTRTSSPDRSRELRAALEPGLHDRDSVEIEPFPAM